MQLHLLFGGQKLELESPKSKGEQLPTLLCCSNGCGPQGGLASPLPGTYANPRLGEATQGRRQDKGLQGAASVPSSKSTDTAQGRASWGQKQPCASGWG